MSATAIRASPATATAWSASTSSAAVRRTARTTTACGRCERYVEEVEIVRTALGLGTVHLLGQSWGTWLGTEYALTYPDAFKTLILADGSANIPHLVTELERLRSALGPETVAMMLRHEAEGTLDHPEYKGAIDILNYRHVCRLQVWPDAVNASLGDWNMAPYRAIQGPNEFCYVGSIKDWNRVPDLHRISQPALVLCGLHDELTPACSAMIHRACPTARSTSSRTPRTCRSGKSRRTISRCSRHSSTATAG